MHRGISIVFSDGLFLFCRVAMPDLGTFVYTSFLVLVVFCGVQRSCIWILFVFVPSRRSFADWDNVLCSGFVDHFRGVVPLLIGSTSDDFSSFCWLLV